MRCQSVTTDNAGGRCTEQDSTYSDGASSTPTTTNTSATSSDPTTGTPDCLVVLLMASFV